VAALAADFLHQDECRDFHALVQALHMSYTVSAAADTATQRFHLHAGLGRRGDAGTDLYAILAQPSGHINVRQQQR